MQLFRTSVFSLLICFFVAPAAAQLQDAGSPTPSVFKKNFLKHRQTGHLKSASCDTDTLYYSQYNAVTDRFINVQPGGTTPVNGVAVCFQIDDTVMLHGFNFYAYSSVNGNPVTCNVYYAAADNRPAGLPIYSQTYTLNTGITILSWMYQTIQFTNPVQLVSDFVITVETAGTATLVFACNDWLTNDGKGDKFTSIKFNGGWSNNITVGTDPFDADFYLEPHVSYRMKTNFEHGGESCLGNGEPFDFINTTTFALNKQFSPEYMDTTLDDDFYWEYGDGSPLDTALHGSHNYLPGTDYWVTLTADFNGWGNSCFDDTIILVEETDINANFSFDNSNGLSVDFTDGSHDAKQWHWDFDDGSNGSIKQNPTHVFNNYGTYQVKQTVRNKGCSDSLVLIVNVESTGIEVLSGSPQVQISPVPAKSFLDLKMTNFNGTGSYVIYNIQGEEMTRNILSGNQRISLERFNQGVYFLKAETGGQVITKRFSVY